MKQEVKLEVVCYNIGSVAEAVAGGADRIELCASPGEGGTTPSQGTILRAKGISDVPVFVMIRPRGGDFLYSDLEFEVMKEDIRIAKQSGADGVVLGILKKDGTIDKDRCAELIGLAYPMGVSCHRAFDMARNPLLALEDCIEAGFHRILTSGQQPSVEKGLPLLRQLVEKAAGRISIMPGAGIREQNVQEIVRESRAKEIHISGRIHTPSEMEFINLAASMGDEGDEYKKLIASADRVRAIKELANNA